MNTFDTTGFSDAKNKNTTKCTDQLSIIHQNLQSIGNSVDLLEDFLNQQNDCDVLCVTEHWKTYSQLENYGVKGFSLAASFCRQLEKTHGGSAIYVKTELRNKKRHDIDRLSQENIFECCGCEVTVKGINIICISVYRPPNGEFRLFLEKMEQLYYYA